MFNLFRKKPKDNIYFDVQNRPNNKAIKKASSFNQIIPSENMTIEEYDYFLKIAKPYELELDVVSQETYCKICQYLNSPIPKPFFPPPRQYCDTHWRFFK